MTKERLKLLAEKLMFTMNEEEYDTLLKEFDIILKQMELIEKIENIENVEPMTFPFPIEGVNLREDIVEEELPIEDILSNSENVKYNQIKLPKVVE
ncbi:MAG: Asp-tRNA(Asn)/Glu-tRNA(Gln) amidotransferase subunit GatC [Bacilli bacterium]|nr:Asp-tRNA(Asn)/Glu-tRNA(Gln) amidotransferase subunit GatC [Bacilli bacterium]